MFNFLFHLRFKTIILFIFLFSFCSDLHCFTFICNFYVEPHTELHKQQFSERIACTGEVISYDGNEPKMVSFDSREVDNYKLKKEDNSSLLMTFIGSKPLAELTEIVRFNGHRFDSHPEGIGAAFPLFTNFTLSAGNIFWLTKDNLKQFANSVELNYDDNKIQYLETDLFIHNTKVIRIFLRRNHITKISRLLGLNKIPSIGEVSLEGNLCTKFRFYCNDPSAPTCIDFLQDAKQMLVASCPEIETQLIADVKTDINVVEDGLQTQVTAITKKLSDIQSFIETEAEHAKKIEAQMANFNEVIERVYNILKIAADETKEL